MKSNVDLTHLVSSQGMLHPSTFGLCTNLSNTTIPGHTSVGIRTNTVKTGMKEVSIICIATHRRANGVEIITGKTIQGFCAIDPKTSTVSKDDEDRTEGNAKGKPDRYLM